MNNVANKVSRYWFTALFLSLAGLLVSLYSADSHYKNYTDPQYSSFCALTQAINCDTVAQSPWSIFLGLPVAWWGVLFFLSFLILLFTVKKTFPQSWFFLFCITLSASLISIVLAVLSVWKIHALCILCLAVYTLTVTLTLVCWIASRQYKKNRNINGGVLPEKTFYRGFGFAICILLTGSLVLYIFLPHYWTDPFKIDISNIPQGLTQEGHPWLGAKNPRVTITQFSDYQCFQCAKMHSFLRRLVVSNPDSIRLIHRNYPMDHAVNPQVVPEPFHEGSGDLAKIAILAALRNKFWKMNDLLYALTRNKIQEIPLQELADATGLDVNELAASLTNPTIQEILRRDIWRGMKLGITGTPAFLIEGNVYQGRIPEDVLKKISSLSKK